MEEKQDLVHVESFGEKTKKGLSSFVKGFVNYSKANVLAYVVGGLALLFLILQFLPAASITINSFDFLMTVDGVSTHYTLNGTQIFFYNVFDVIFGRNESLLVFVNGIANNTPMQFFTYYVPFNVWVGIGMLFIYACVVLIFINKRLPRIIGASLGVVGLILISIFLFIQPAYNVPIVPDGAQCSYQLNLGPGVFIALILALATVGLSCYICVKDNLNREKYKKDESERYRRGGI